MGREPAPMTYAEGPPAPPLAPYVAAFWRFAVADDAGEIEHRIPLTGGLLLTGGGPSGFAMLTGPRVAPLTITVRGGERYFGVHFRPGGARPLLGLPAGSLRDAIGPARFWLAPELSQWGESADPEPACAALEAALLARLPNAEPLDPEVAAVVDRLVRTGGEDAISIARLASEVGLSPRQLRRRFANEVGLSPKQLLRLRRLRASAADVVLHDRSWGDIQAERGFADQPHLVREFKSLLGTTPGDFERHARRIEHRLVGDEPER